MKHRNTPFSSCIGIGFGAVIALSFSSAVAAEDLQVDPGAHTAQAVIAVDDHWSQAEVSGDTAWLNSMLLPEYRSIGGGRQSPGQEDPARPGGKEPWLRRDAQAGRGVAQDPSDRKIRGDAR
ncbi:MAG: hypothetical protein ACREVO_13705 [Steroidobacteraceae bacterium]